MASPIYDLGGNTLVVDNIKIGATAPGQAGTDISTTELGFIDGVTAGTAAASKAVVLNASKGISTITSATITTLTSTTGNITDVVSPTNLTLNATSTGTIGIGSVSSGAVTITPATTVTGLLTATAGVTSPTGVVTKSGTAVPASAGAVAAGAPITMFSTGIKIWVTSDVPAFSATKGDLCINTGGSSTSTRMYVNNGTTNWVAFTTAS